MGSIILHVQQLCFLCSHGNFSVSLRKCRFGGRKHSSRQLPEYPCALQTAPGFRQFYSGRRARALKHPLGCPAWAGDRGCSAAGTFTLLPPDAAPAPTTGGGCLAGTGRAKTRRLLPRRGGRGGRRSRRRSRRSGRAVLRRARRLGPAPAVWGPPLRPARPPGPRLPGAAPCARAGSAQPRRSPAGRRKRRAGREAEAGGGGGSWLGGRAGGRDVRAASAPRGGGSGGRGGEAPPAPPAAAAAPAPCRGRGGGSSGSAPPPRGRVLWPLGGAQRAPRLGGQRNSCSSSSPAAVGTGQ